MKKLEIIRAIDKIVSNSAAWTIGITDDPVRRKIQHNSPACWRDWEADTEAIAKNVEKHFLDKGMKGGGGGGDHPNYVYIF